MEIIEAYYSDIDENNKAIEEAIKIYFEQPL